MFKKIIVPVDLAHADALDKALTAAGDMAKHYDADLVAVGVTAGAPSKVAHSPEEYSEKLTEFAEAHSKKLGVKVTPKPLRSRDPSIDIDQVLMEEIEAENADLVVMASHVPGFAEMVFSSRAGYLASHAKVSVFVVR